MKKGTIGALAAIGGAAAGAVAIGIVSGGKIKEKQKESDKHLALYLMMNQWLRVKQEGKNLSSYFKWEGYQKIAIYGMHYVGEALVEELMGSNVAVAYGIDKNADRMYADFPIITPDSDLEEVDAVVVTTITFFEEVEALLKKRIDCPIVSLKDIIDQV